MTGITEDEIDLTPIQKFYSNTNIFITGATGFLGKVLLEKLIRSCPSVSTIYVLIRNKKGKNSHARLDELFDDVIFDNVKKLCPKFRHKIVGIGGDCSLLDLGINQQDRQTLIERVSVIFHVAATVRFDEKLKTALNINVRGAQQIVQLARQMSNLKVLMHVSTAYSNCPNGVIEEKIYASPIDSQKLLLLSEAMPDKILDNITPLILDKWPNTYTFTKAIAEDLVKKESDGLPIGILRPAVVVSSYKEPIRAWINNLYGPTGVCAGAGTGVLRTMHCDPEVNANIVPVDMCVNSLIAAAWEVGTTYSKQNNVNGNVNRDIPVYHFESSNDQPLTWGKFMHWSAHHGIPYPSTKAIWYYCLTLQKHRIAYLFTLFFLHYLPALFVDVALLSVGKNPKMLKIYKKIHKFSAVISYFATREFRFRSSRVRKMLENMSEDDKRIFFCDLKRLNWEEFFTEYMKGIRVHLIQDPMDSLEDARVKWKRLYWLHQITKILIGFLIIRVVFYLFSLIYNISF